ncbi:dienelactone hydrolase family protein [Coralloluteibacterium stylophorae]|uniref:Dienelactone hydrolase family protein n=2 Tax=Coralloluteibacterium stylophorae TaxID=1776034 RepID=A0AAP2CC23_9GAMM|nr:dienelactone hydrolase family protein [Coralloluteibacterium stylophorae]MBS7458123.1 dienelactone hydrolase family protein [Coralloluteibacterium stylophorae]
MGSMIRIAGADGAFGAWLAQPGGRPRAAIVVVQEIFGINDDLRETCARLADEGFLALCPDLFWRLAPGIELSHLDEADWQRALGYYRAFDFDAGVADIAATVAHARTLLGAGGRVGVMGFCLGGLMTFLAAARIPVDAAVAYYGGGTEARLDEADGIRAPLLMHLAEADEFIPPPARAAIVAALAGRADVEVHTYPGCRHAFARNGGAHYDAAAATLANARTDAFLRAHLG